MTFIKAVVHPKLKLTLFCHCLPPVVVFSYCETRMENVLVTLFFAELGLRFSNHPIFGFIEKIPN